MSRQVLIVGAAPVVGEDSFYARLLADASHVIACDAAAEWCVSLGRVPEIAVGDFDSAAPGAVERLREKGVDVRVFPAEKDESDLDLAVEVARTLPRADVVFTAAYSERLDHTLAALGTVYAAADLMPRIEEPRFFGAVLSDRGRMSAELAVSPGAVVSVMALGASTGVTLRGLRYPLDSANLPLLSSLGLSNVACGSRVSVALASGTLLVIASRSVEADSRD